LFVIDRIIFIFFTISLIIITPAHNHRFTYNEPMTTEAVTQSVCDLCLRFGEGGKGVMSRPFGVALLIAGCDKRGPQLFHADPSGTFIQFEAKAIGAGSEGAQTVLQEKYNRSMTLKEAQDLALDVLKQVMEEKLTVTNVEIACVTPEKGFHVYSAQELEAIISK
jgi:20S proteasome subunit alpha 5